MDQYLDHLDEGLRLAIAAAGSKRKLAKALGITPQAVTDWKKVPIERVLQVEAETGVSRRVLAPRFFGGDWGAP